MSGLNYKKLGSTLSNICNTTQLDNTTKCHYAFKKFWGEPWKGRKYVWKKEKMLVTQIFSFSHNFFKKILFLGHVIKSWDCVV